MGIGNWSAATALLLVFAVGSTLHLTLYVNRNAITQWSNDLLLGRIVPPLTGMAATPRLGPSPGFQLSPMRVLRIEGMAGENHFRGASFEDYTGGRWGPSLHERSFVNAAPADLQANAAGPPARVTRFQDDYHLLFVPLNAAGVAPEGESELRWASESGITLRSHGTSLLPLRYEVVQGREGHQGPLCSDLDDVERRRCLQVPSSVSPKVRELATRIGGGLTLPEEKARAVEAYLTSHHRYSLQADPGAGDPVSNFLLQGKAAHCQFFASSAAILLRCLGVPARYASGYYAHETAGPGVTVVRGRDAHAWTEYWSDGRGWLTLDATPGNGRPDALDAPVPPWLTSWEWLQDRFLGLTDAMSDTSRLLPALLGGGTLWLLFLAWRLRRGRRTAQAAAARYTSPGEELAELARRFEELMARAGLRCPEHRTWTEYLKDEGRRMKDESEQAPRMKDEPDPFHPSSFILHPSEAPSKAAVFLREYNSVRFGRPEDPDAVAALRDRLHDLVRDLEGSS